MPTEEIQNQKDRQRRRKKQQQSQIVFSKETFITALGVVIVLFELVNAELFGRTFHYEFLVLAAGCLGLAIMGWGDGKRK